MAIRSLVLSLALAVPATAQIVQTSSPCPPAGAALETDSWFVNLPVAGQSLTLGQYSQVPFANAPVLHVKAIGFVDPMAALPSCGCVLRTSLDILDAQAAQPSAMFPPLVISWWSVQLPPAATGLVFRTQAFAIFPTAPNTPGACDDIGMSFVVGPGFAVTVL